jgi:hypothetical protein
MIKNIVSSNPWLVVSTGYSDPYIYAQSPVPNPATGTVRYNNSSFEIWTGSFWQVLANDTATINLSGEAIAAIEWVHEKMAMEKRIAKLAKDSPAVADALASVNESIDQLQVVIALANKSTVVA